MAGESGPGKTSRGSGEGRGKSVRNTGTGKTHNANSHIKPIKGGPKPPKPK